MNKNQNAIDFEIDRLNARISDLKSINTELQAENERLRVALILMLNNYRGQIPRTGIYGNAIDIAEEALSG